MSPQRSRHELPDEEIDDGSPELFDLPAAVVCARCGRADCAGCDGDEAEAAPSASGVVLVVPWERPEQPLWSRFWATTRLGVDGAEVFFSSLPDGPVGPALSYAALAELVAVGACVLGFAALALGALGALVPVFTRSLLTEPWGQAVLGRVLTAAWGSFAALLVGVHALHGWALHRGAASPRSPLRRALRFGLYTAGLDVAGSPVGVLWLLSSSGRGAARNLGDLLFRAANRATLAMLRGFYQLDGAPAERLRRRAMALSVAAVVVGLALCAAAIFAAA